MSELASNAKKRGDKAEALRWYREAFEKSEGPATRLQWGVELHRRAGRSGACRRSRDRERRRAQLWGEAATQPDAFYERSGRSLQRVGTKLQAWNKGGKHARGDGAPAQPSSTPLCAAPTRSADERATCEQLLGAPRQAERLSIALPLPPRPPRVSPRR